MVTWIFEILLFAIVIYCAVALPETIHILEARFQKQLTWAIVLGYGLLIFAISMILQWFKQVVSDMIEILSILFLLWVLGVFDEQQSLTLLFFLRNLAAAANYVKNFSKRKQGKFSVGHQNFLILFNTFYF